jgi:hypothetical protein
MGTAGAAAVLFTTESQGKPPKTAFAENLVKPPGAPNSRQRHDSIDKINMKTIAYLPPRIC